MVFNERLRGSISNVPKIVEVHFLHELATKIWKTNNVSILMCLLPFLARFFS